MNVVLIAAISADGKIAEAGDQNSTDWTSKEDTAFFVEKTKELGVVIMGRTTFDTFKKPLKGRRLIVMTARPEGKPVMEGVEYTSLPPKALIEKLQEEGVQNIAIAGGARVYSQFLEQGFVKEMYLTMSPYIFGGGVPLAEGFERIALKLEDVSRLGESSVLLHYLVEGYA